MAVNIIFKDIRTIGELVHTANVRWKGKHFGVFDRCPQCFNKDLGGRHQKRAVVEIRYVRFDNWGDLQPVMSFTEDYICF